MPNEFFLLYPTLNNIENSEKILIQKMRLCYALYFQENAKTSAGLKQLRMPFEKDNLPLSTYCLAKSVLFLCDPRQFTSTKKEPMTPAPLDFLYRCRRSGLNPSTN